MYDANQKNVNSVIGFGDKGDFISKGVTKCGTPPVKHDSIGASLSPHNMTTEQFIQTRMAQGAYQQHKKA